MNKVGGMYLINSKNWVLYPSKDLAARCRNFDLGTWAEFMAKFCGETRLALKNSCVVLVEEDENYKKILTDSGNVGWIHLHISDSEDFQLVKDNYY